MSKTFLKRELRYHTFVPEKVPYCRTYDVTAALCIAVTYRVYWRNWGFQSTVHRQIKVELKVCPTPQCQFIWCSSNWAFSNLLFIDRLKWSLKCVLLHNANLYGAVPIGHSACLREEYRNITKIIQLLKCTNTIGSSVLTLKWWPFFLVSNADTQSILVFRACGTAELESIGWRWIGLHDPTSNLVIPTLFICHL